MKVSLISTVYNECSSIRTFLDSLLSMSKSPEEIIIVDAGSNDGTIAIIQEYKQKYAIIHLIIEKNCNIARGRNIAIQSANYEIIAATDAGCKIDKYWLENIIAPFERDKSIDVVSGWYKPVVYNFFQRIGIYINPDKWKNFKIITLWK